jgi:fructokinase
MARQRVIVGIGEIVLRERPDSIEPGGLPVLVARHAARLGNIGIPISRLGQDRTADELMPLLTEWGVNTQHLQSDPDLPTGKLVIRSIGGRTSQTLTSRAAFDNLQWDFDLVDVAQQADAVLFGGLARREGQSRSIIKRFLAECPGALRIYDLTNRSADEVDRNEARTGLEFAEAFVADQVALKILVPGWNGPDVRDAALAICAAHRIDFVVTIERNGSAESMTVHSLEKSWSSSQQFEAGLHEAAIVAIMHGVLAGWDLQRSLRFAERFAQHSAGEIAKPVPTELMNQWSQAAS